MSNRIDTTDRLLRWAIRGSIVCAVLYGGRHERAGALGAARRRSLKEGDLNRPKAAQAGGQSAATPAWVVRTWAGPAGDIIPLASIGGSYD